MSVTLSRNDRPAPQAPDSPRARVPKRKAGGHGRRRPWLGLLYLAPGLILYAVVVLIPAGQSVWLSFFNWNGVTAATWAGFSNYTGFFGDPTLRAAAEHTLTFLVFFSVLPIILGLISAALSSSKRVRAGGVFRSVVFIPQTLTPAVTAVVWKRIYEPDGPINEVLRAIGLGGLARSWLGDYTWALPALGLIGTWAGFGLCTVLFLSGMQNIPSELYDAARVDGAGPIREFFTVTLPGLRGPIAVVLTVTVVGAIRVFDIVWLTTRGGPGTTTVTPTLLLYERAFANPDIGSAAAIGVVITIISLLVTVVILKVAGRDS
jgi:raffinose/stachyose/melibiose transport system permease protein